MRTIVIPDDVVRRATEGPYLGTCIEFAVSVNWPELRLTEGQIIANAIARANGQRDPYPDQSIFSVTVPYRPLEKVNGVAWCSHCSWNYVYPVNDPVETAQAASLLGIHARACDKNPLVAEIARLRRTLHDIACGPEVWTRDQMIDHAEAALIAKNVP